MPHELCTDWMADQPWPGRHLAAHGYGATCRGVELSSDIAPGCWPDPWMRLATVGIALIAGAFMEDTRPLVGLIDNYYRDWCSDACRDDCAESEPSNADRGIPRG